MTIANNPATASVDFASPVLEIGKALVKPAFDQARKAYSQRQAIQIGNASDDKRLREALDSAIARLTGQHPEPSWLKTVMAKVGQLAINPADVFERDAVREWLHETSVRDDLVILAAPRLVNRAADGTIELAAKKRLADRFESKTGEIGILSRGIIDVVLDVLLAGIWADISGEPSASALAVILQTEFGEIVRRLD